MQVQEGMDSVKGPISQGRESAGTAEEAEAKDAAGGVFDRVKSIFKNSKSAEVVEAEEVSHGLLLGVRVAAPELLDCVLSLPQPQCCSAYRGARWGILCQHIDE
jgi:hypothetical protein